MKGTNPAHHGKRAHTQQGQAGCSVRSFRPISQERQNDRQQKCNCQILPQRVHQCRVKGRYQCAHRGPPFERFSNLSRSFSISSSSCLEDFLVSSACITSARTEPPNARLRRSLTSWRCVCSCE